jgi:hypothetical protein
MSPCFQVSAEDEVLCLPEQGPARTCVLIVSSAANSMNRASQLAWYFLVTTLVIVLARRNLTMAKVNKTMKARD